MGGSRAEQSLCACYSEYQEFKKVVELKDIGLVIYCHTTRREDVQPGELFGTTTTSASQDAFILHNTKDVKITSPDLKPALDTNDISCPRCKQIFQNAQELLQKVKLIDKKNIMGVCDHCLKKAQSIKRPCNKCEEIAKKFISTRDTQKEDTKRCIKVWLSRMSDIFKDAITSDKKVKTRAYSDLQIDQLYQYSPKSRREPEVKQMFYPETPKSDTNLCTETDDLNLNGILEKSVGFTQPVKSFDKPFAAYGGERIKTITSGPWLVESNETFGEALQDVKELQKTSLMVHQDQRVKQEHFFEYYDDSTMDVKKLIKKKHDISLRRMIRTEKKTRTPFRPQVYEIPKVAPWEQDTISKHSDGSETELYTKTKQDLSLKEMVSSTGVNHDLNETSHISLKRELKSLQSVSKKPTKYMTSKTSQNNLRESQQKKDNLRSSNNLDESIMDVKGATKRKLDLNIKHMMRFERDNQDHSEQHRDEKIARGKITKGVYASDELRKETIKQKDRHLSDDELKYKRSLLKFSHENEKTGQRKTKTKIEKSNDSNKIPEYVIRKQFSFFFPKSSKKKENVLAARSSQLIINTQERLRQRAEEEKKRHEEERKHQLEEEEKNKLARDERKRFAEEKKKQQIYVEDQKQLPESIKYTDKESLNKMINEEEKRRYKPKDDKLTKDKDKLNLMPEYATKEFGDIEMKDKYPEKEKGIKDVKLKTEPIDKIDVTEKKGLKPKSEEREKKDYESEKNKGAKSKSEPRDITEGLLEKTKKDLKSKFEPREKRDVVTEKSKKEKNYEVPEKAEKDFQLKAQLKDKSGELTESSKRDSKSKSEPRDKIDASKAKIETGKDKKSSSKKTEELSKENAELPKKAKKLQEPSADTEALLASKEKFKEFSKKQQDMSKEKDPIYEKKHGLGKKVEPSKKKDDSIKDTEVTLKGKEKYIPKKEESTQPTLESKEVARKAADASKKPKDGMDAAQLKKLQAELAKQKEEDLKNKRLLETEAQKLRDLADKKVKEEADRKSKVVTKEGKAAVKPESERPLKHSDSPKKEESGKVKGESKEVAGKAADASKKPKDGMDAAQLKKLQAELAKQKEEDLKNKRLLEAEAQKLRDLADKKAKEEAERKSKVVTKEAKAVMKSESERPLKHSDSPKKEDSSKVKGGSKEVASKAADASKKPKDGMDAAQLKKLQAELAKQKEEDLKNKRLLEAEAQKLRDLADKKAKEEAERKSKVVTKEAKAVMKPESERPLKHSDSLKKEESAKGKGESKEVAGKAADASKKPKDGMDEAQFRKLQAELAKQKEESLKNKRLLEAEAQKLRDLADKKAKEEAERKSKGVTREAKAVIKPELEPPLKQSAIPKKEESVKKELKIPNIKIRNISSDDLILKLVRIKQTATGQTIKPRPCDIDPEVLKAHKCHHKSGQTSSLCELCNDSDLEIDVESYENEINLKKEVAEIIIGEKIFKHKPSHLEKTEEHEVIPIIFQSIFQEEPLVPQEIVQIVPPETETVKKPVLADFLQSKNSKGTL